MGNYYQKHIFICTNRRESSDKPCCANRNAVELLDYAKTQIKTLHLSGKGKFRINSSGCMD